MTASEIRDAIEPIYARELGADYPAQLPANVTPQAWDLSLPYDTTLSPEVCEYIGKGLAAYGRLHLDLNAFARLEVEDRPEAKAQGHMRTHKRPRQFVVRALGWRK